MSTNEPLPVLDWLPVAQLYVDTAYQRSLATPRSKALIAKIVASWDWKLCAALLATPGEPDAAGPRWLVIDGQHRATAARERGDIERLPALVFPNVAPAEQAAVFAAMNRDRVAMSAQALFHANVMAGEPNALAVDRVCRAVGITITRYNVSANVLNARHTAAVPALLRILKRRDEDYLRQVVEIVFEAWGQEAGALRAPIFEAVALLLADKFFSRSGLLLALSRNNWRALVKAAENRGGGNGGSAARTMADMMRSWMVRAGVQVRIATAPPAAPPKVAAPPPRASGDDDEVARFIAERGVNKLPGVGDPALRRVGELVWDKDKRKWTRPQAVAS